MAGCLRFIHYCMNLFTSSTKSKCLVKDQAHMTRSLIAQISVHLHVPRLKSITIIPYRGIFCGVKISRIGQK